MRVKRLREVLPPPVFQWLRHVRWRIRRRAAAQRLRNQSRLNLGCGSRTLPGWANIDLGDGSNAEVIRLDLLEPWPVDSATADFIFSEHLIEHLTPHEGRHLLNECRRVLRRGAVLRISTPDLRAVAETYLSGAVSDWIDPAIEWLPRTPAEMINDLMRQWGHRFLYDFESLSALLREIGAKEVRRCAWHESVHPELQGLERRAFHHDLIVEAAF
jgi:predicted SAM-dependent methyltransferase